MIEESLRRIVANNRATREAFATMSSRVIGAILSGSDEELESVIDELAGSLETSAGDVLQEQDKAPQSVSVDSDPVATGEQPAATSEPGSGESLGTEDALGQ